MLLGLGLDNEDGHKRITQAEGFFLVGGSQETHEKMTETAIKTFEDLRQRGKSIANVEKQELADILHKNRPKG
jgi:hypothetical protein